jgi:ribosomal protein L7/L12
MTDSLSNERWERIEAEILARRKITAIKLVREYLGADLRDAKQLVDHHERTLREQIPEKFRRSAKGGCTTVLLIAMLASAAVVIVV